MDYENEVIAYKRPNEGNLKYFHNESIEWDLDVTIIVFCGYSEVVNVKWQRPVILKRRPFAKNQRPVAKSLCLAFWTEKFGWL